MTDEQLPHDITAEQAVLATIMVDNACLDRACGLAPEDLFDPLHQFVFRSMLEYRQAGKTISPLTLRGMVEQLADIVPGLTVHGYLNRLPISAAVPSSQIAALAEIIRDLAARRRMTEAAKTMAALACDRTQDVSAIAADGVSALNDIIATANSSRRSDISIGDAAKEFTEHLQGNGLDGGLVPTGLRDIDRMLGGWPRGGLSLLAGRPSMGKTTLATSIMLNVAKSKRGVIYFSLEMPTRALTARVLADVSYTHNAPVEYAAALRGDVSDHDLRLLGEAAYRVATMPLTIDDQRGLTVAEIGARVRKYQGELKRDGVELELVVVDHLGLIKPSARYSGNRVHEITELSDGLATIARDTGAAVVALSQLNRGVEARDNKRPGLADLRDSGSLEQDADVVMFAFRPAYYLERTKCEDGSDAEFKRQSMLDASRNAMEAIVAKQRNGETGVVNLFAHMPSNAVRDAA